MVRVQPQRGRALRARHGPARIARADAPCTVGSPLAARAPPARRLPLLPERPGDLAPRVRGVLGEPTRRERAAAPARHAARRRARALRVAGAVTPSGRESPPIHL